MRLLEIVAFMLFPLKAIPYAGTGAEIGPNITVPVTNMPVMLLAEMMGEPPVTLI